MEDKDRRAYLTTYQRDFRKRKKRVDLLFEKEEYAQLERVARRHGYAGKVGAFIREASLAYIRGTYLVPDEERVRGLELALRRIGTNINQITRHAHTAGVEEREIDEIRQRLRELEETVGKLFRQPQRKDQ